MNEIPDKKISITELEILITNTIDQLLTEREGLDFTGESTQRGIIQAKNRILEALENLK